MTHAKVKHVTGTDHVVDLEASDCGALIPNLFNRPAIPEHKKSISCNRHKHKMLVQKSKSKKCIRTKRKSDVIEMTMRGDQGGIRKCGAHTRILALGARYDLHYDQDSTQVRRKNATIFPLAKMRAVVFGSRRRMMAALNLFGLYLQRCKMKPWMNPVKCSGAFHGRWVN
jgi:hypothetical protein